ncbi:EAL domain-containing protein [Taklimakanibacter deserti]|uniref:EAL domain-containing protein n=1 Tax=Taklimakanibacter deserti TaxID=2267839 RepID=UPI000E64A250
MALLRISIAFFLLLLLSLSAAAQDKTVDTAFDGPSVDLLPHLLSVDTDKPVVTIRTADDATGLLMELPAKGSEPVHRWVVATLTNSGTEARDVVVATPHQGFAGSGILWPKPIGSRIQNVVAAGQATIAPMRVINSDAFALRIEPKGRVTVAMELTRTGLDEIEVWQRNAFDAKAEQNGFYRGVLLGIAMLLGVIALSLYAVRTIAVFPFASVFIWSAIAFIALESGYLPQINDLLPKEYELGPEIRAVIEGLMVVGLILCLVAFADLRRRRPVAWNILLLAAGLLLALPVYGWFEPAYASGIARIAFAVVAALGCVVIFAMWREGAARARVSLLSWVMIVAWTVLAAVAALTPAADSMVKPFLSAGLVLVILTMSFALAQFAFAQGFLAQRFFAEDARRALALAASQQCVWDWQVEENNLHVGEDIEKILGLRRGSLKNNTPEAWLDLVHPADRSAYLAAVEEAERRGHGSFSQEFRLRRGDGTFRWFLLRARAIPGAQQRAARCIGTLSDITATRRAQDQLLSDAVHDRVTGLPNRALLVDRIEREISAAGRTPVNNLYLMLIDLDRFKAVNDGLGHETGDGLLKIVGRRLAAIASEYDTVARMPGDQFAILFHGDKPKRDILPFTDKVRATVSKPVNMRPQEIFLTASVGVSALREGSLTAEGLVKDAAVALYEAKRRGKDTVEFFREAMRDDRTELVVLEAELRRAIERNEIEVLYQPIARLADMELAGFEALVRWRHKSLGLLGPETFIGLAETTGIIKDIGHHVLNEAGRQLGIWQRAFRPHDPLFVAVNVSSSQFLAADLIDDVKALLTREGLVRDTLKLEVTESIVMENPELVSQILERLRQMGIGVACDDFGTGYSSLSNLRRMPFDTLKVDRSFIEADADDAKASLILESIILLAHDLGLTVVAEGIQSQDDVDRLGALACDFGQGYFIGEPMTAKQVVDVLSGVPLSAAKHKTTIDSLWERMAGTSNVRVPEPLRDAKPAPPAQRKAEPPKAPPPEAKPKAEPAKAEPVKQAAPEPAAGKPPEPPPAEEHRPPEVAPPPPPPETKLIKPGKPPIVLLPPLTPPVFVKPGAGGQRPAAASPPKPAAEAPPQAAAPEPQAQREEANDLVKSEPTHAAPRPLPGGAPMAPRASAREEAEEEGEELESADEPSADESEPSGQSADDAAAQKAKAARLGKKLRRKMQAKDQPPAEP